MDNNDYFSTMILLDDDKKIKKTSHTTTTTTNGNISSSRSIIRRSESLDSGTFSSCSSSSQQQSFSSLPSITTSNSRNDKRRRKRNQHNSLSRIGIILRLLLLGCIIDYMYVFLIKDHHHVGVGGQTRSMFVSNTIIDVETIMDNPTTSTVAGGVSSSTSTATATAISSVGDGGNDGGGVVLMGIFSHSDNNNNTEIRDNFRQRILQIHNNNNNENDNDNNDKVVICNLDTYLQQQQQQQNKLNEKNHCNFVYTFVMFGVGTKAKGSFMNEEQKGSLTSTNNHNETTTTTTTNNNDNDENNETTENNDILFLYNPSKKETKSQVWLKYVASKVKDITTSNIDYVAKLELPPSPQSQTSTTTTTTTNTVSNNNSNNNNNTTLLFDFNKFWNFATEYLPLRPNKVQQKHLFVSSFTNYEYCDWPEHVLRVPSNLHKPQPSRSTIHLYASKQFWLLSTDLVVDYTKITYIIELSEYWKHRNVLKLKSCEYLEEYELSTSSFQYYFNNEPLNIIPISEQYKFWNINNNNNNNKDDDDNEDDNIASSNNNNNNTSSSSSTLVSPQPSQKQQRSVVATTRDNNGVVLMGIFCQLQDKTFRDLFRNLFKMHPKACSLGTFIKKQQQTQKSSSSLSCEFVYGFVIGALTTNTTTTPTERVTGRLDEVLIMNHSKVDSSLLGEDEVMNGMHDDDDDDFVFLNIRENMEEGKSTTWLYAASLIANTYNIDYVGKMDTDTLFYLDRYFDFANKYLPPAPYNQRRIASAFADKAWWGYNVPFIHAGKEHSYTAEKETHFKTHYPGSDPTRFGIHIYLQGQMYIISQDLAMGVAEMAHFVSTTTSSSNVETAGGNGNSNINNKKKKDYYRNHLENIEDLDVSTMAYLWLKEKPMNHILIKQTNKFWIHDYRLKERPGTIGMIRKWGEHLWEKEMNRLKNMTHF